MLVRIVAENSLEEEGAGIDLDGEERRKWDSEMEMKKVRIEIGIEAVEEAKTELFEDFGFGKAEEVDCMPVDSLSLDCNKRCFGSVVDFGNSHTHWRVVEQVELEVVYSKKSSQTLPSNHKVKIEIEVLVGKKVLDLDSESMIDLKEQEKSSCLSLVEVVEVESRDSNDNYLLQSVEVESKENEWETSILCLPGSWIP